MPKTFNSELEYIARKFYKHITGVDDFGCKKCKEFILAIKLLISKYALKEKEISFHNKHRDLGFNQYRTELFNTLTIKED